MRSLFRQFLFDKAGDPPPQGGTGDPPPAPKIEDLVKQNAELLKKFQDLEAKMTPKADDPDLATKAKLEREEKDKKTSNSKSLESAIKFNLGAKEWLKTNESLLPKTIASIFEMADKETYTDAIEKDSAIKLGIVSEFFAQQANVDLLTESQKTSLEEFLKLTKTVKQERSQQMYESIFEPTFEGLKRVKKAEALREGQRGTSEGENAYKDKMIKLSAKHYLGEK